MSQLPPSQTAEKIVIRLPDGMRDRLAEAAKANGRSTNAEVVARLSLTLDEVGDELNALGMHAVVRRLDAATVANEEFAQRLLYQLYLIAGIPTPEDDPVRHALDAYIASLPKSPHRHHAIRAILEDWLTEHGFMPGHAASS